MKDARSILLVLLSIGLVSTWVYHLYDKTQYSKRRTEIFIKDSIAVAEGVQDSLQKIYAITINSLDNQLDSTSSSRDSLQSELSDKMTQISNLKNEIDNILGRKGATREELDDARGKIRRLQQMVNSLRTQNTSMEQEQLRLLGVMNQLSGDMKGLEQNIRRLDEENKALTEKINLASVFVASELRLSAVTVKGSREVETSSARKTEKFVISFTLQNNINQYSGAEVYVIILAPDGRVLRNPTGENYFMDTKNEGRREYTMKVRFDYDKGEQKRHLFSLNAEHYARGNYTMRIYHNGYRIGEYTKTLI